MSMPQQVRLVEVGPRDGLQNEKQTIDATTKIELINRLSQTGLKTIEAGAFVSPKWVPQMADTDVVFNGINHHDECDYPVLVPNEQGMMRAIECGAKEIAIFTAASEGFCQKNINCSVDESLKRFEPVLRLASEHEMAVRAYVSCVVACPYDGPTKPQKVRDLSDQLLDMGAYEISLGDTIGVATPHDIDALLKDVLSHLKADHIALHCHDTYGCALANIAAALNHGIRVFDASIAGLGGCPYATGASGNVATEDVIYMLHGMGYDTGVDIEKLVQTSRWFTQKTDLQARSKLSQIDI